MSSNIFARPTKKLRFFAFLGVFLIGIPLLGLAQGNITGQFTSTPLAVFEVDVLDATNAVLVATISTNDAGYYIGSLPAGDYKVRFTGSGYSAEYVGANGVDSFDLGQLVTVREGHTTVVNGSLTYIGPALVCANPIVFSGIITDASNSMPLEGIKTSVVHAISAMPQAEAITNDDEKEVPPGFYYFKGNEVAPCGGIKVRFSDPNGSYLPQYYGANGQDVFVNGQLVNDNASLVTFMVKLTPTSSINSLENAITNSDLPASSKTSMTEQLNRANVIVNDSNPNNDTAACGVLNSIINETNAKLNSGALSASEADALKQSAETARSTIGCR